MSEETVLVDQVAEMNRHRPSRDTALLGAWSASAVILTVAAFAVALVVGFRRDTLMVSFTASLLLAPAFVGMMVSIAVQAPPEKQAWGHLGLAFAAIYAVMVSITYYLQLTVVRGGAEQLSPEALRLLEFTPGSSPSSPSICWATDS